MENSFLIKTVNFSEVCSKGVGAVTTLDNVNLTYNKAEKIENPENK